MTTTGPHVAVNPLARTQKEHPDAVITKFVPNHSMLIQFFNKTQQQVWGTVWIFVTKDQRWELRSAGPIMTTTRIYNTHSEEG